MGKVIEAIVFDLDGVLLDSEQLWDRARRQVARDYRGTWLPEATAAMQGMSSVEWAVMRAVWAVRPSNCAAVEDSANGIRAAVAAQMVVIAVPNREFRPPDDVLGTADLVIDALSELTVERLEQLSPHGTRPH